LPAEKVHFHNGIGVDFGGGLSSITFGEEWMLTEMFCEDAKNHFSMRRWTEHICGV
jgi:hypothetical protein